MGSIRGIKTKAKVEEKAAEALKREIQDRQWAEDYESWQHSHDPNNSEHNGEDRHCFGWPDSVQEPLSPQCRSCNAVDTCASAWFYWKRCHVDPVNYDFESDYDYEQDRLWGEEYKDWIEEQSREE